LLVVLAAVQAPVAHDSGHDERDEQGCRYEEPDRPEVVPQMRLYVDALHRSM
jgi:hypothetical protein